MEFQFRRLDKPNTGEVDWWSFVDSRIVEKLSDRSKVWLVTLSILTTADCSSVVKITLSKFDFYVDSKILLSLLK